MTDTTFEEARRCPKCKHPGESIGWKPVSSWNPDGTRRRGITPGAKLHEIHCRNGRCPWFNTPYFVQVNPDGTVPPPDAPNRMRNRLAPLDPALAVTMKDHFESLREEIDRQGRETTGR